MQHFGKSLFIGTSGGAARCREINFGRPHTHLDEEQRQGSMTIKRVSHLSPLLFIHFSHYFYVLRAGERTRRLGRVKETVSMTVVCLLSFLLLFFRIFFVKKHSITMQDPFLLTTLVLFILFLPKVGRE